MSAQEKWTRIIKEGARKLSKNKVDNWLYFLITNPELYLKNLLKRSLVAGLVTLLIVFTVDYFGYKAQIIPNTFHSLLGFVMGMLLVFRSSSAYERWWKAREFFSKLEANYMYLTGKVLAVKELSKDSSDRIADLMDDSLENIKLFLVKSKKSKQFKEAFTESIFKLLSETENSSLCEAIERSVEDILQNFTALERIKDTPIPKSYALHIKISIFIYILTLPLGLFHELGYLSVVFVMILFFIIAGIEIISLEIENPFIGDPNDLPVEKLISDIQKEVDKIRKLS